jgi:hypothetical protein
VITFISSSPTVGVLCVHIGSYFCWSAASSRAPTGPCRKQRIIPGFCLAGCSKSRQFGRKKEEAIAALLTHRNIEELFRTPIWWRNARISSWNAARVRKEADSEEISAVNMCAKGNRTMSDNSQSISAIGVCENHSQVSD